ncbi:hypothetical protein ACTXT7_009937 [Hymenolepis weldensis]
MIPNVHPNLHKVTHNGYKIRQHLTSPVSHNPGCSRSLPALFLTLSTDSQFFFPLLPPFPSHSFPVVQYAHGRASTLFGKAAEFF